MRRKDRAAACARSRGVDLQVRKAHLNALALKKSRDLMNALVRIRPARQVAGVFMKNRGKSGALGYWDSTAF